MSESSFSIALVGCALLLLVAPGCANAQNTNPPASGKASAETASVDVGGDVVPLASSAVHGWVNANVRTHTPPPDRPVVSDERKKRVAAEIEEVRGRQSIEGHTLSALVIDAETGDVLYEHEPDKLSKPASNTKMFTTAAALELLGPDYRIVTRVYGDSEPDENGVISNLYLVGRHDFTWSKEFYNSARFPLDQLARRLADNGVKRVDHLWAYGEFVVDGFRYDEYKPEKHREEAAEEFRDALQDAGVEVEERGVSENLEAPESAVVLSQWESIPLHVACLPINRMSHNEFADALLRHLGFAMSAESTYEAGASQVINWLESIGIDTVGVAFYDGSGLSHDNRVSARHVVQLIRYMQTRETGPAWDRTLSVAGVNGTYAGRMTWPETRGRVFAKSGTLDGVITTSGFLVNSYDGRKYVFSLLMNEVDSRKGGRVAQNYIVKAFAGDLLENGERPASPVLSAVEALPTGDAARVEWIEAEGARGYRVWVSRDGRAWDYEQTFYSDDTTAIVRDLQPGAQVFARVTAWNQAGESQPSDVYGATVGTTDSRVLVVDGNDRWDIQGEQNPMREGHDFVVAWGEALGTVGFDTCANEAVASGRCQLGDYRAVFWALGEESDEHETFDLDERSAIGDYLAGQGNLWVSGAELGFDLCSGEDEEGADFYRDVLRADHAGDDAQTFVVEGSGGIFADIPLMHFFDPGGMNASVPDQLEPMEGASACLRYVGGQGGVAAIQYEGNYRLLNFGFPFESIDNAADRRAIVSSALSFFEVTASL